MANRIQGLPPQLISACAVLASGLMAIVIIAKVPLTSLTCITVATPLIFLCGVWNSYRALSGALGAMKLGELKTGDGRTISLQERVSILAIFGLFGIAISLFMGLVLGHMSAH